MISAGSELLGNHKDAVSSIKQQRDKVASTGKSADKAQSGLKPPKRPLSAYNIFMKYERARMLMAEPIPCISSQCQLSRQQKQHIITSMVENSPYKVDSKTRIHRKTHGKVAFKDLIKQVSKSWNNLDGDTRAAFEELAYKGRQAYKKEKRVYKMRLGRAGANGSERTKSLLPDSPRSLSPPGAVGASHAPRAAEINGGRRTKKADLERALELATLCPDNFTSSPHNHAMFPTCEIVLWGLVRPLAPSSLENIAPLKDSPACPGVNLDHCEVSDRELTDFMSNLDWDRF